jgi:hypothetical protein
VTVGTSVMVFVSHANTHQGASTPKG